MAERQTIRHDKAAEKSTTILQELLRGFCAWLCHRTLGRHTLGGRPIQVLPLHLAHPQLDGPARIFSFRSRIGSSRALYIRKEHYFLTLAQWLRRLEANEARAKELVGDIKYRAWRLYRAGSEHYFRTGKLDLYQTLLTWPLVNTSGLPLTRGNWYRWNRVKSQRLWRLIRASLTIC